jgi:hypothetical protein
MTKDQKIIKGKVGLLGLARQLGNVSQACKMLGYRWRAARRLRAGLRPGGLRQGRSFSTQARVCFAPILAVVILQHFRLRSSVRNDVGVRNPDF